MLQRSTLAALYLLLGCIANAQAAEPVQAASKGELLYSTHCIACHSTQVHWREKKLAKNWSSLQAQVRHWEGFSRLKWSESDVEAVAEYVNKQHYHYPILN